MLDRLTTFYLKNIEDINKAFYSGNFAFSNWHYLLKRGLVYWSFSMVT